MDTALTTKQFRKRDIPPHLLKYFNFKRANRWILRNKIKWAKQVLIKKDNRTIGSVMPSSVKDRFNESGEELYFFVKSKKYYFNLDAVRMPQQTNEDRPMGIVRQDGYDESKYNKFNYRVRDAKRKEGQPQFKASEEEIKHYKAQGQNHNNAGIIRERLKNKVHDPRGNHEGGPGSWRDFKDENVSFTSSLGKNLPTVWQIGREPHNFQKELEVDVDHFAIFPQALVEIPIKSCCPKNGIILDPFMGSGTTALASKELNRNFIGIELNKEYIEIANKRLSQQRLL